MVGLGVVPSSNAGASNPAGGRSGSRSVAPMSVSGAWEASDFGGAFPDSGISTFGRIFSMSIGVSWPDCSWQPTSQAAASTAGASVTKAFTQGFLADAGS